MTKTTPNPVDAVQCNPIIARWSLFETRAPAPSYPLFQQCSSRLRYDVCGLVDELLGQRPIFCVHGVADSWEERFVIPGPQLWTKDDMLELCSVWNL